MSIEVERRRHRDATALRHVAISLNIAPSVDARRVARLSRIDPEEARRALRSLEGAGLIKLARPGTEGNFEVVSISAEGLRLCGAWPEGGSEDPHPWSTWDRDREVLRATLAALDLAPSDQVDATVSYAQVTALTYEPSYFVTSALRRLAGAGYLSFDTDATLTDEAIESNVVCVSGVNAEGRVAAGEWPHDLRVGRP